MIERQGKVVKLDLQDALDLVDPDRNGYRGSGTHDSYFAGATKEESRILEVEGYREGANSLKARAGVMAKVRESNRPKAFWDTSGSQVDMGRFMTGEPENMVRVIRQRRAALVCKLGIERWVNAGVSKEDIETVGAGVLAAVEALRTAGVPTELWITYTFADTTRGNYRSIHVLLQEAGKPIDADRLAYWTMHPAALRVTGFDLAAEALEPGDAKAFGFYPGGWCGYLPGNMDLNERNREFDELAPSFAKEVESWLDDVLMRRAGVDLRK